MQTKVFKENKQSKTQNSTNFQSLSIEDEIDKTLKKIELKKMICEKYFRFYEVPMLKYRPSLIDMKKSNSYGIINHLIVECERLPYNQMIIDDKPEAEKDQVPTVKMITETLFDINTIIHIESANDFPPEVPQGLIITNIDSDMTASEVNTFLEGVPILKGKSLAIEDIRLFTIENHIYAFVQFQRKEECQMLYNYFNHPEKKAKYPSLNSKREVMAFSYFYNLADLKDSKWYGVVLRDLDNLCDKEKITTFCESMGEGVLDVLDPVYIKDSLVTIVVMSDLDLSEKLCSKINQSEIRGLFSGRLLKAFIHPKSSKKRQNPSTSHYASFFRTKVSFSGNKKKKSKKNMNSSSSLINMKKEEVVVNKEVPTINLEEENKDKELERKVKMEAMMQKLNDRNGFNNNPINLNNNIENISNRNPSKLISSVKKISLEEKINLLKNNSASNNDQLRNENENSSNTTPASQVSKFNPASNTLTLNSELQLPLQNLGGEYIRKMIKNRKTNI